MLKKAVVILLCLFSLICYGQINDKPTEHYTLVIGQNYPTYKGNYTSSYTTYENPAYASYYGNTTYGLDNSTKAPQSYSGSATATVDGVTVVVTYTVTENADYLIYASYTITYSDGSTETYSGWFANFGQAKKHAQEEAQKKAQDAAEEKAHSTPLGCVYPMLIFAVLYAIAKNQKILVAMKQLLLVHFVVSDGV